MLEHIPEPEKSLDEFIRICKNGGCIYLDPAYNCRSWTVKKLVERSYHELKFT